MNRTERTTLKKRYKIYMWLTISSLFVFIWGVLLPFILNLSPELPQELFYIFSIFSLSAVYFNYHADIAIKKLKGFKKNVKEYRIRLQFIRCLNYLENNDAYSAYITFLLMPKILRHRTKDYIFPIIIHELSKSTNPKLKEIAEDSLNEIKDFYNPDKVIL